MGIRSVCRSRLFLNTEFSRHVPCVRVYDGFVGVGENHQLVRSCGSALLRLEVLADGFAQHGMTEVFLPVQNIADGGCAPTAGVYQCFVPAIFGRILCRIRRRYQYLFLCQHFGNRRNADALTGKAEYLSDDFSRRFIHDKGLLKGV